MPHTPYMREEGVVYVSRYEIKKKERQENRTHFFKRCASVTRCGYYFFIFLNSDTFKELISFFN